MRRKRKVKCLRCGLYFLTRARVRACDHCRIPHKKRKVCTNCGKVAMLHGHTCSACRNAFKIAALQRIKQFGSYYVRDLALLELGYPTYDAYLNSPLYASVRTRAFQKHGHSCHICRQPASAIHPVTCSVTVLLGEKLSSLVPICDVCHYKIEFDELGRKRSLFQTYREYHRLYHRSSFPPGEG